MTRNIFENTFSTALGTTFIASFRYSLDEVLALRVIQKYAIAATVLLVLASAQDKMTVYSLTMPVIAVGTVSTMIHNRGCGWFLLFLLGSWHNCLFYLLIPICFSLCRRVSLIANDTTTALPNALTAAFAVVPVSTTLSIRQGVRFDGIGAIL